MTGTRSGSSAAFLHPWSLIGSGTSGSRAPMPENTGIWKHGCLKKKYRGFIEVYASQIR